jgi:hypothetical protein
MLCSLITLAVRSMSSLFSSTLHACMRVQPVGFEMFREDSDNSLEIVRIPCWSDRTILTVSWITTVTAESAR